MDQKNNTNVYVNHSHESNGSGVAGMVLAILAFFIGWIPVIGWILWILGMIFSLVGLFHKPRVCAIIGTIITFIDILILIGAISALFHG